MHDHRHYDDLLWHSPRDRLDDGGRLSHLVFVDGRLVDAWSERAEDSAYADICLLYTSPSPRDGLLSRMPSSA